jgi:two-component system chemotaxis sensor kinase CheA
MPADSRFPSDIPADEMADYLRLYLEETGDQLDQLVQVLLALEVDPAAGGRLNEAFRLVHSIKGSAAMMGFDRVTTLAHHLETHFERLRSGSRRFDEATADVALRFIDHLRACNSRLRDGGQQPAVGELLDAIKSLDAPPADATAVPRTPAPSPAAAGVSLDPGGAGGEGMPSAGRVAPPAGRRLRLAIRFAPGLPMGELRAALVLTRLSAVGTVVSSTPPADRLAAGESLATLEVILDSVAELPAIRTAADADGVEGIVIDEATAAAKAASGEPAADVATATAPAAATVRVDVTRLDALLNLTGELLLQRSRLARQIGGLVPAFRKSGLPGRLPAVAESLRDLVGRLRDADVAADLAAAAEAALAQCDEQTQLVEACRRQVSQLVETGDRLTRVSDALQRGVLLTRMVPVGPLFGRFKRSVRDIAAELGKQVRLELDGEDTELDKRMIDALGDPIVHLIRNAIDHGIEPADVRLHRGKPEVATLSLAAEHRGNHVVITIGDDGGGIDTRRIRQRLVDRGLVSADEAAALDERALIDRIWHPGFSTASRVSDISGRGVGMDIVRTAITALGGGVEVFSAEGRGTTFVIRLPLTLAIAPCLLFRVPHGVFAAPLDDVREIVTLCSGQVVDVRGRRSCEVRGDYLPVVTIDQAFAWGVAPGTAAAGGFAVVLQSGERRMALEVDELLGREELVVKSLADNFTHLRGIGGAGILGDGTVCLLLDVATTIDRALGLPAEAAAAGARAGSIA